MQSLELLSQKVKKPTKADQCRTMVTDGQPMPTITDRYWQLASANIGRRPSPQVQDHLTTNVSLWFQIAISSISSIQCDLFCLLKVVNRCNPLSSFVLSFLLEKDPYCSTGRCFGSKLCLKGFNSTKLQ